MTPTTQELKRSAFEEYAMRRHCWQRGMFAQHSIDDYYLHDDVENEWQAWCAGFAQAELSRREAEAVKCVCHEQGVITCPAVHKDRACYGGKV